MAASFLNTLKNALSKTRESIVTGVAMAFTPGTALDDDALERIEEALLLADAGMPVTERLVEGLRRRKLQAGSTTAAAVLDILRQDMGDVFSNVPDHAGDKIIPEVPRPYVIMVVGVNGAGKTTTVGKLAHLLTSTGLKVLIGSGDTFRAAAHQQLGTWATRAGAEIIGHGGGSADPASVAFDAVSAGVAREADVVLLDTAGRLHTKSNLMEELKKIHRVVGKKLPGAPHETLLVLDATTGQNGLQQARLFAEAASLTGVVLTKLDGTAKGGVVLGIAGEHRLPVRFIGVGEGPEDLQPFDPKAFVDALIPEDAGSLKERA